MGLSKAEIIAALPAAERDKWFRKKRKPGYWEKQEYDWSWWRRPEQVPPDNDWRVWLTLAGRGFGKTRMGAEWVREQAERDGSLRIALVGATLGDVRQVMIEGRSGLLSIAPDATRPNFEPSLRKLSWPNGAEATLYSAGEPDSLRGPEHHIAWCDELAKWDRAEDTWNNLSLTLRLGNRPQIAATTTPRAVPLVRRLITEKGVALTRGLMEENKSQLPRVWRGAMRDQFCGTRFERQELDGELIEDAAGALWSRALIEACRVDAVPEMKRIVIGVDPPASLDGDACGIVVVGRGVDDKLYVLADCSVHGSSPEAWARAVANAAMVWNADRVVAEGNNGGNMVESTLRAADIFMPIRRVHATHGKFARAEPVAMLYEAGKAHHVRGFPALEDELCGMISGGYAGPGRSPDRADALVWAATELMLGGRERVLRVRVL
jgi:phage terminase large subunit-like protein